jgi:hypothetical protein
MTTNAHRWAARVNPVSGRKMTDGFCTAHGCGWHGTRQAFYAYHLFKMTPKLGDRRSWRYLRTKGDR